MCIYKVYSVVVQTGLNRSFSVWFSAVFYFSDDQTATAVRFFCGLVRFSCRFFVVHATEPLNTSSERFSVSLTDFAVSLIYMIASLERMWYMPFWVIGFHIMQMPVLVIENMNPNIGTFIPAFCCHIKMKPTILNMIASLECTWYTMPFWVIGLYTMQMPVLVIENIKKMSFNIGTFILAICCHLEMKPTILYMIASLECGWHVPLLVIGLYIVQMPVLVIEKIKPIMGTFIPAFRCVLETKPTISCVCTWCVNIKGGYRRRTLKYDVIKDYLLKLENIGADMKENLFEIVDYVKTSDVESKYNGESYLYGALPPEVVVQYVPVTKGKQIAALHGLRVASAETIAVMKTMFESHVCDSCISYTSVLVVKPSFQERMTAQSKQRNITMTKEHKDAKAKQTAMRVAAFRERKKESLIHDDLASVFPPDPVDKTLTHHVVSGACIKLKPETFEEAGCAVCGQLIPLSKLSKLSAMKQYLHLLEMPGTSRQERLKRSDKIKEYPVVIDHSCHRICNDCCSSLRLGKVPQFALAKGLWIGAVPDVLSSLRYIEKMLVSRVRYSCCSIRIASGMRKMKAHAIAYQQPMLESPSLARASTQ
jgi:hypothetical protein